MKDPEIFPLLHQFSRVTFFTRDRDFARRHLCHTNYCLVHLVVGEDEVADFIRRVLRHPELNTRTKRMGKVIRVTSERLQIWRPHAKRREELSWSAP